MRSFKANKVLCKELKLTWVMCACRSNLLCNILGALHPAQNNNNNPEKQMNVAKFYFILISWLFSLFNLQPFRPEIVCTRIYCANRSCCPGGCA